MIRDRAILDELLRRDLGSFVAQAFRTVSPADRFQHNWHIDAVAHALIQCFEGKTKRLIINVPPRSLKSICASVAFPAWALGRDPSRRIICASYSNDLSAKLARDTRTVMESAWYKRLFPKTRLESAAQFDLRTTAKGMRYATSVEGTLTGMGGDILIVDDPLKPQDALSQPRRQAVNEWYNGTLFSRLNNKIEGVIILIMQRLHTDDLVAHVLEKENWTHLNIPAIGIAPHVYDLGRGRTHARGNGEVLDPAREPQPVLNAIRETLGTYNFNAQYQQCPSPIEGNLVKQEWFNSFDLEDEESYVGEIVQSWDTASKAGELNDYSVCTTWKIREDKYLLLDVLRERLDYPSLRKRAIEMSQMYQAYEVLIEDQGSGIQLIQDLKGEPYIYPRPIRPDTDKITRLSNQTAKIEMGQVWLPRNAPWLDTFLNELLAFPNARHDDQVDSFSQFLNWECRRPGMRAERLRGL